MIDLIKIKKITSTTALAILMMATLGVQAGFSNNGNGNGNNNTHPGQAKKICKNNNGIGNNYDVEYTLRNETFSIRIDPGNNGQMNKFKADLTSRGYTTAEVASAVTQITDAEMQFKNSNGNNTNCLSSTVSSGNDYSTLYANISDFSFYRSATDQTNFHTTAYGTQGTGVAAFQQFVNKERQALDLTQLNARKLDASKLTLSQAKDIKIYFINEGAGYRNQLKLETLGSTLLNGMIFKDASVGNATDELRMGDYVNLGTVAAGTTLDFQLRANGANNANPDVWYGDIDKNSDKIQHVIAYQYQNYLVLAWEDLHGGGDKDYNDIVFAIDIGQANLAAIPDEPPANQPPVANPDAATTPYQSPITVNVLANDTDPEDAPLTISTVSSLTGAKVEIVNGQVKYTPKSRFYGTDYFSYTIKDNRNLTSSATVTVNVNPRDNHPPVAVDDSVNTNYQTEKTINVKINDSDPDGDALTIIFNQPLNGAVRFNSNKSQVIYTPNSGYSGVDTFTYQVADIDGVSSNTATVTVTVGPRPNKAPIAVSDAQTTLENTSQTIDVTANDSDPDRDTVNVFKIQGTNKVSNAYPETTQPNTWITLKSGAKVKFDGNNQVIYNPDGAFDSMKTGETKIDTFKYFISDGYGKEHSATVTMTIQGVTPNTVPTAANDSPSTNEDAAIVINVKANDTDADGDTLTITKINGTDVQVGNRVNLSNGSFLTLNNDSTITYNPNHKFDSLNNQQTGTETFTYTISDGRGGIASATVTVTINGITNTTTD
jgi:hypothetical protein